MSPEWGTILILYIWQLDESQMLKLLLGLCYKNIFKGSIKLKNVKYEFDLYMVFL